jgi:hypothetical protein
LINSMTSRGVMIPSPSIYKKILGHSSQPWACCMPLKNNNTS